MKTQASFLLPFALMTASTIVGQDDFLGQLPACAQRCAENAFLQYCPQTKTAGCICTAINPHSSEPTDFFTGIIFIYNCIMGLEDLTCNPDAVLTIMDTICLDYPILFPPGVYSVSWSSTGVPSSSIGVPPLSTRSVHSPAPTAGTAESGFPGDVIDPLDTTGPTQASKSSGLSNGVIVGITISTVAALGIVAGLIMYIVKVKHPQPTETSQVSHSLHPQDYLPGLPPQNYPLHPSTPQQPPTP